MTVSNSSLPDANASPASGTPGEASEPPVLPASDAGTARGGLWRLWSKPSELIALVSALVAAGSLVLSILSAQDAEESAARATQVATDALAAMQSLARAAERSANAAEAAAHQNERLAAASVEPSLQFRTRGDLISLSMSNDGLGPAHVDGMFLRLADNGVTVATAGYFMADITGTKASKDFQDIIDRHRALLVRALPAPASAVVHARVTLGDLLVGAEEPLIWVDKPPAVADAAVIRFFEPVMMAACYCNTFSEECYIAKSAEVPEDLAEWAAFHDRCLARNDAKDG